MSLVARNDYLTMLWEVQRFSLKKKAAHVTTVAEKATE